jgi:phosphomannomutase
MNKLLVFDLDDTLTESKSEVGQDMADVFEDLLRSYPVGVISGCTFTQFEKQFVEPLIKYRNVNLSNLYLLPSSGTQMWSCKKKSKHNWTKIYEYGLLLREKVEIYNAFYQAWSLSGIDPATNAHGEIAEDRGSQITFSFCGQDAPLEIKKIWDPNQQKRLKVAQAMKFILGSNDEYEITVGGATSIDVTKKGFGKDFGISKLMEYVNYELKNVLFVGDALFEGGNDFSIKKLGVESFQTSGPAETIKIIKRITTKKSK